MKVHKMTKYDAGQVLIKAFDTLTECAEELKELYPEQSKMLRVSALEIGTHFNASWQETQGFGLPDLNDLKKPKRKTQ